MADTHGSPAEGAECMICYDDISAENYVEYQTAEGSEWVAAKACETCVSHLLHTQYEAYVTRLKNSNCKAEQRRMLTRGPPINVSDPNALPCPDNGEVHSLWFASDSEVHSAKLDNSLTGEERQKWWDEQKAFLIVEEPEDPTDAAAAATTAAATPTTAE